MGGTPWAVAFSEPGDCAVVQQLDPLDRSMDAVAVADGEAGEAFVFFIPWGYLLPSLLLEALQSLVEVSNGLRILVLLLVMDPILLPDGSDERLGEVVESDRIVNVESLNEVGGRGRQDEVSVRDVEIGDGHRDCHGSARGSDGRGSGELVREEGT